MLLSGKGGPGSEEGRQVSAMGPLSCSSGYAKLSEEVEEANQKHRTSHYATSATLQLLPPGFIFPWLHFPPELVAPSPLRSPGE